MLTELPGSIKKALRGWDIANRVEYYNGWLGRVRQDSRDYDHTETVNNYYSLCSEFMTWGWNNSLHFAPLAPDESLQDSIVRHQRHMIKSLQLQKGMRVIDVGCGIGEPMRRVARESGARVLCLNNNEQQLEKAKEKNLEAGLDHLAEYIKCNFMDMSPIEADSFDAGYAIESTCHAPDKERAFAEIFRVLKPGALFWGQEMCLTDEFDLGNSRHLSIKDELMQGIALSEIATFAEVNQALEAAGFQVIEAGDKSVRETGPSRPWYEPMEIVSGPLGSFSRKTLLGRRMIIGFFRLTEAMRIFPKGSVEIVQLMDRTAEAYIAGGKTGIFTPLYCFLARKPL